MKIRPFTVCASAILVASLMGVSGGTASADQEGCAAINGAIQGQLAMLGEMAISNPPGFLRAAPAILSSIQALRLARPECGGPPIPSIEQLMPPPPAPQPNPQTTPAPESVFSRQKCQDLQKSLQHSIDTSILLGGVFTQIGGGFLLQPCGLAWPFLPEN
jgi:hypothetical protein